nr:hypothetical protein Iba_chr04dCG8840 [Ipomoea batatas]
MTSMKTRKSIEVGGIVKHEASVLSRQFNICFTSHVHNKIGAIFLAPPQYVSLMRYLCWKSMKMENVVGVVLAKENSKIERMRRRKSILVFMILSVCVPHGDPGKTVVGPDSRDGLETGLSVDGRRISRFGFFLSTSRAFLFETDVWASGEFHSGLSPRSNLSAIWSISLSFQSLPELSPSPSSTLPPLLLSSPMSRAKSFTYLFDHLPRSLLVLKFFHNLQLNDAFRFGQLFPKFNRSSSRIVALVSSPPQVHLQ